jgi:hypothetical protein
MRINSNENSPDMVTDVACHVLVGKDSFLSSLQIEHVMFHEDKQVIWAGSYIGYSSFSMTYMLKYKVVQI